MLLLVLGFIAVVVLIASLMTAIGVWVGWAIVIGVAGGIIWVLIIDNLSTRLKRRHNDQQRENEGYAKRHNLTYVPEPYSKHPHR